MTISVVIPTYNYAHYLPQAIDSVLGQTVAPLEIVVADDGSTDNTAEVVGAYGDKIKYRIFKHAGIVALRNTIFQELRGEWILNLDADDWIEPNFIAKALELLNRVPVQDKLAFIYADRVDFGAYDRYQPSPEFDPDLLRQKNFFPFNAFIRREVALAHPFDHLFDDGWEDYDFWVSLVKNGWLGIRLPEPPVHCRVHVDSRTASTFQADRMQRLMKKVVAKHSDFFTREEAEAAVAYFSPEAVIRHQICELVHSGRFCHAVMLSIKTFFSRPQTFFSICALRKIRQHYATRKDYKLP